MDLHPEDLLELDAQGQLSAEQLRRLEHHLQLCEVCRFERRARAAFRSESADLEARFAVSELLSSVPIPGSTGAARRPPKRSLRRLHAALLAAALGLAAMTSAAAAGLIWLRSWTEERPSPPALAPSAAPTPERAGRRSSGAVAPATRAEIPAPAPPGSAASSGGTTTEAPRASPQVPAAALFARANEARRAGERRRAIDLYESLVQRYPASSEAHHARAVLGRVFLDDGRPDVSLRYFDAYLQRGGALAEDVLFERAVALQRLGRPADEASAWRALLAARPTSVHAARARERLAELEVR